MQEPLKGNNIAWGATLGKGNGSNEEGYGRDEGEYEKDESHR